MLNSHMEHELRALVAGNRYFEPMLDAARQLADSMAGPDAGISAPFDELRSRGLLQVILTLWAVCGNERGAKVEELIKLSDLLTRASKQCAELAADLARKDDKHATGWELQKVARALEDVEMKLGR